MLPSLFEPNHRADLVEPLRNLEARKFSPTEHRLADQSQVIRARLGNDLKGPPVPDAQTIVNIAHGCGRSRLVISHNLAIAEFDVAGVPLAVVAKNSHQSQLARSLVGLLNSRVAALEIGITVEDEERRAEQGEWLLNGAGGSTQFRAIK